MIDVKSIFKIDEALIKLLSASMGVLTIIQGFGTALSSSYGSIFSQIIGLYILSFGIWMVMHEIKPALAPFDLRGNLPFLRSLIGKSMIYGFLGSITFASYFGNIWNWFVFVCYSFAIAIFLYKNHTQKLSGGMNTSDKMDAEEDLVHCSYQTLEVIPM